MSMTVTMTMAGMDDAQLIQAALDEMGISWRREQGRLRSSGGRPVEWRARMAGNWVGFVRGSGGDYEMVGDSDWRGMQDERTVNRLRQHYSLAAVRRKARELNYTVTSVESETDGSIRVVARAWG